MNKVLLNKLKESSLSIIPLVGIIIFLSLTIVNIETNYIFNLLFCALLLVLGMGLFTLGADNSMLKIGRKIGTSISKSKKIWMMVVTSLVVGIVITIAEPDLAVLAAQVASINKWVFMGVVALGTGIFLAIAILRTIFNIPLGWLLGGCYALILVLSFFVPNTFVPISFDASGVTTGAVSVPFLVSFGFGISSIKTGKTSENDNFGTIALCSTGPIIAVMLMGLFSPKSEIAAKVLEAVPFKNFGEIFTRMGAVSLEFMVDVAAVLVPITIIFFLFQFDKKIKTPVQQLAQIIVGLLYTYVGIVIFLTGVTSGLLPMGVLLGNKISALSYNWILIPIAIVMGLFMIIAEPSVHILNKQIEDLTGGLIRSKTMMITISIGVSIAFALAVIRAMYDIPFLYIIVPIYVVILALLIFTPEMFTGISFDSGGVACGTMSSAFVLPFIMGTCQTLGTNVTLNSFGNLAIVAAIPILAIQILGLIYKLAHRKKKPVPVIPRQRADVRIIEFDY